MRTWRVGTFSMGLSLIMLGVMLFISQWFGFKLLHVMVSWWPLILVVLGVEILLYLLKAKEENPFLKYDFLSIIFVGVLGTVGIGFALLSSTGLIDKAEAALEREYKTFDLPVLDQSLNETISRVVVNTNNHPITIEGTSGKEISMFGTYEAYTGSKEALVKRSEDYVSVQQKGDTLYVNVKGLPTDHGIFSYHSSLSGTLLVPNDIKLEVNSEFNQVTIKPRLLVSEWSVAQASHVSVQLQEKSNVLLSAVDVQHMEGDLNKWQLGENENAEADQPEAEEVTNGRKNGTYTVGEGTSSLQIIHSDNVSVTMVK
ncbi:hypothetical protein K6959_01325 [Bacillus aquiflavi]|uniref:hypothetical protein n=1 Tax=Bacillus aquiflavi TaxID=2672567 RepID=UPI001CA8FD6F|nr:hypothetical protein [Bacillus aquiflavi]UAC48661.1 hypothetical protein K6959_01325 [Bacillus aquiflavi]